MKYFQGLVRRQKEMKRKQRHKGERKEVKEGHLSLKVRVIPEMRDIWGIRRVRVVPYLNASSTEYYFVGLIRFTVLPSRYRGYSWFALLICFAFEPAFGVSILYILIISCRAKYLQKFLKIG